MRSICAYKWIFNEHLKLLVSWDGVSGSWTSVVKGAFPCTFGTFWQFIASDEVQGPWLHNGGDDVL